MLSIVYGEIFLLYAVVLKNLLLLRDIRVSSWDLLPSSFYPPSTPRLLGGILYVVPLSQSLSEGFNTYFLYSHIHGLLIDFVVLLL